MGVRQVGFVWAGLDAATEPEQKEREGQRERVLRAVRQSPGHTPAELARIHRLDVYAVRRRLTELQAAGLVSRQARQCGVLGRRSYAYRPAGAAD